MYRFALTFFLAVCVSLIQISTHASNVGRSKVTDLPELMVESNRNKIVHILAYVRDYSTMSTATDTVYLFREKLVDFMLPPNERVKFKGWNIPRILTSKSYYRFTNSEGLDSVSDESSFHFSWADWVGMPPLERLPEKLGYKECGVDTLHGKYSACEVWKKDKDTVNVNVDILADKRGRRWCPTVKGFFQEGVDFYDFRLSLNYENVLGNDVSPLDLTHYSFTVESNGRGHEIERIKSEKEKFYFTTKSDVYVIDREYISAKDARKWESHNYEDEEVELFEPAEAPPLDAMTRRLIERVGSIDKGQVRVSLPPDERLGSGKLRNDNFNLGKRALFMLKQLTGITLFKSRKNEKSNWRKFKEERIRRMKEENER